MSEKKRGPFTIKNTRAIYENPWLQLREDQVIHSSGRAGLFGVVEMKPGATVLALSSQLEAYVLREFKYALGRPSIELMSGGLDGSESPLEGAKRELREELGLTSSDWVDLGVVHPFTSVIHSPSHLFVAFDVIEGEARPEGWEEISATKVPFKELHEMVLTGVISHAGSCVCILKAAHLIDERGD